MIDVETFEFGEVKEFNQTMKRVRELHITTKSISSITTEDIEKLSKVFPKLKGLVLDWGTTYDNITFIPSIEIFIQTALQAWSKLTSLDFGSTIIHKYEIEFIIEHLKEIGYPIQVSDMKLIYRS